MSTPKFMLDGTSLVSITRTFGTIAVVVLMSYTCIAGPNSVQVYYSLCPKQAPQEAQYDSGRDALSQLLPSDTRTPQSKKTKRNVRKNLTTPSSSEEEDVSIALFLKRMADSREELTKRAKYDSVITNLQIALKNEREAKLCDDHRALAIWSAEIDFLLEQKKNIASAM